VFSVLWEQVKTFNLLQPILAAEICQNTLFVLGEDLKVYECDVNTSKAFDLRSQTGLREKPACLCTATVTRGSEMVQEVYIVDHIGNLIQVGKEDAVRTVFLVTISALASSVASVS
jgi:hypothetical protein